MRIRKLGHSCLLVEEAGARVLLDPGVFAQGLEGVGDLDAVLITHIHPDHVDADRIGPLAAANPEAAVVADADTVAMLGERGIAARAVDDGDTVRIRDLGISVIGHEHAVIHPDLPRARNVGYLIGGRLLHPGDALTVPETAVEILAIPVTGPWQKLSETIDYLRAVRPATAIPIHEMVWRSPEMAYERLRDLGPDTTAVAVIDDGVPVDF